MSIIGVSPDIVASQPTTDITVQTFASQPKTCLDNNLLVGLSNVCRLGSKRTNWLLFLEDYLSEAKYDIPVSVNINIV